jgi:hypothetical protein
MTDYGKNIGYEPMAKLTTKEDIHCPVLFSINPLEFAMLWSAPVS